MAKHRRRLRPRGPKGYGLPILAPKRSRERLRCSPGFELGRRCSAGGRRREPGGRARQSVVTGSTQGVSGYWICRRGPCGPCEGGPGVRRTWTSPAASNRAGGVTLPEMASGSIPARWAPGSMRRYQWASLNLGGALARVVVERGAPGRRFLGGAGS